MDKKESIFIKIPCKNCGEIIYNNKFSVNELCVLCKKKEEKK